MRYRQYSSARTVEGVTHRTTDENEHPRIELEVLLLALWLRIDVLQERRLTREDVGGECRS